MKDHSRLHVGAASVSITPDLTVASVALQGYKLRLAEGVDEPIVASALAIGSEGPGHIDWLLISLDLIGIDRAFTARIRETLAGRLPVSADSITLACSHTHSGPASLANLGQVPVAPSYLVFLEARVIEAAEKAAAIMQPAALRIGTSLVQENVNRRERKGGQIVLGTDPDGPVDHRVWVGRFDAASSPSANGTADGVTDRPLAIIVQYACHATCSGDVSRINADWPGAMRKALQGFYARDGMPPVVCVLQGCAGDITHSIGRDVHRWPEHFGVAASTEATIMGRLVAAGAITAIERSVALQATSITVSVSVETVDLPFHDSSESERTELQVVRLGTSPTSTGTAVPGTSMGASIWLVFLPGEPFAAYGEVLRQSLGSSFRVPVSNVVVSGYTNDAVGYLCTPQALREGGYEAAAAHRVYHRPAAFGRGTLLAVQRACTRAAARLDRQWRDPKAISVRTVFESIRSAVMRRQSRASTGPLV
jgi:neutral ceramidase